MKKMIEYVKWQHILGIYLLLPQSLATDINGSILGIVPELFNEDDDSNLNIYSGDDIQELEQICDNATTCEECDVVAINSRMILNNWSGKLDECDELAQYNFKRLKLTKKNVRAKSSLIAKPMFAITILSLYISCLLVGVCLCIVGHFRFVTLWNKLEIDSGNGMRSFRYERMKFKFDYDDPGAVPETGKNYDDWILYESSDEEDDEAGARPVKKNFTFVGGRAKAALQKRRLEERMRHDHAQGTKVWPWIKTDYKFSKIPYREGLSKDMQDWRTDLDSNFISNI